VPQGDEGLRPPGSGATAPTSTGITSPSIVGKEASRGTARSEERLRGLSAPAYSRMRYPLLSALLVLGPFGRGFLLESGREAGAIREQVPGLVAYEA
jgi:hypothetical protein